MSLQQLQSLFPNLQGGNLFQLPGGGIMWMPPAQSGAPSVTAPTFTLPNLLPGTAGGAPDLSGLLSTLAPILGAAVPQLAPFLPIIGALFNILHALTTKNNAAVASGAPNPDLQAVHDAAWTQALTAFGQKPAALVPSSG